MHKEQLERDREEGLKNIKNKKEYKGQMKGQRAEKRRAKKIEEKRHQAFLKHQQSLSLSVVGE